jgi:hypothetical protein
VEERCSIISGISILATGDGVTDKVEVLRQRPPHPAKCWSQRRQNGWLVWMGWQSEGDDMDGAASLVESNV